jgi:thiamine kinase-like enzyme
MARMREAIAVRERVELLLGERHELGVPELCDLLDEWLDDVLDPADDVQVERLTKGVYRLRVGARVDRSFVFKLHQPAIAQTDRLVAERWLPKVGLQNRCPRLLAAVAQREGRAVWHVYEGLRGETLADQREPARLGAAIDLIAELHTRGASHPLLAEVRWYACDHGVQSFLPHLHDGIAILEAVGSRWDTQRAFATARSRLLERLHQLLEESARRVRDLEAARGPDTLLHGDLWPKNVFVAVDGGVPSVRLVDWDHVGVGSFSYDLSTLLYQSPPAERPWILRRYRRAVEGAGGWPLPSDDELNLLFHAAEVARGASSILWPAMALLEDGAGWGLTGLVEIEQWFAALRPPLEDVT